MLQALKNIFGYISGFFTSISNFISYVVSQVVAFFRLLGQFVEFVYNAIQLIPIYYQIFGTIIISILIIMIILGRESGGDS